MSLLGNWGNYSSVWLWIDLSYDMLKRVTYLQISNIETMGTKLLHLKINYTSFKYYSF